MQTKRISLILAWLVVLSAPFAHAVQNCAELWDPRLAAQKNAAIAHAAITSDLFNGRIVSLRPFKENDNRNLLFLVTLEAKDPYTGHQRRREAFFKPSIWGDNDGWARAGMEYVMYDLNLELDMDYIPPTAYRRDLSINFGAQHFTEGAFIYRIPEFTPMNDLPTHQFNSGGDFHDAVISDHRILAVIGQNQDGHAWNLGQGRHWVDGVFRPAFLDWGASLRHGTRVTMTKYAAWGNTAPVTRVRAQTLAALKRFGPEQTNKWVKHHFISQKEADQMLKIKDGIARYFEGLIAEKGEGAVVIRQ